MLVLIVVATSFVAGSAFDQRLFVQEMLKLYNEARKAHEVPPVRLSTSLSTRSAIWADYLSLVPGSQCLRHSNGGGENLYFYWSTKEITENQLALQVADAFYREIRYYNYANPGFRYPAAHFTEMVWKSVSEIGIAVHQKKYTNRHGGCRVGGTPRRPAVGYMVVIQHNPKGNRNSQRQFLANVLRPVRHIRFV